MAETSPTSRLRQLDFLRGIAILLVLFRHEYLFRFTHTIGWIGVDLFFVLSGFFVSGLLFKEYLKFGNINPGRFLIRRGFKIYPIYYIFYPIYLIPVIIKRGFNLTGFLGDITFLQNYVWGWGYAFGASWSLAVEEHFYFGLVFFLWLCIKKQWIKLQPPIDDSRISRIEIAMLSIMLLCLIGRIISNYLFPFLLVQHFTMTHVKADTLLAGVLIGYLYHFRINYLKNIFKKYKKPAMVLAIALVAWTPFIRPFHSFFAKTFGFTTLYISFGIVLILFLLTENINDKLNYFFSKTIVNFISKIGVCSYAIYIIHSFMNIHIHLPNQYVTFLVTNTLSILAGILITNYIEKYFLQIRDKYFPSRSN